MPSPDVRATARQRDVPEFNPFSPNPATQNQPPQKAISYQFSLTANVRSTRLEVFNLSIFRRIFELRCEFSFQIYAEESSDAVRRHENLAANINAHNA